MLKRPSSKISQYGVGSSVHGKATAENFFNGGFNTQDITRDPLVTGYGFIVWRKLPTWVTKEYPDLREMHEKLFRSFNGLQDIEMNTSAITEGFSNSEYQVATSAQNFQGFSMNFREYSGSPIRNSITHWVSGIRDPRTNLARYPKEYGLEYSAKNHTGELLYIMTRPDADNASANGKNIEFACLMTAVMPTRIPLSHMNYTAGSNDTPEIELSFTGVPIIGPKVDDLAVSELGRVSSYFKTLGDL